MHRFRRTSVRLFIILLSTILLAASPAPAQDPPAVKESNVRAHEEFLSSDALNGRGSGTRDEWIAAAYIGSQFRQFGIEPAGDPGFDGKPGYVQTVPITQETLISPPRFSAGSNTWTHGREIMVLRMAAASVSGKLQKLFPGGKVQNGAAVFIHFNEDVNTVTMRERINTPIREGAAMLVIADTPQRAQLLQRFQTVGNLLPELPIHIGSQAPELSPTVIMLSDEATKQFDALPDGTVVALAGEVKPGTNGATYNAIGVVRGSDPRIAGEVILLTAHLDHLGFRESKDGDNIYNGADDDASGVTAVLEIARALGSSAKPRRTVYFVCFGSEERGKLGAQHFLNHPPVPLEHMIANLEFEMIGRGDSAVPPNTLWLTGWERSNLGPALAKQGARLVGDPHPEQNFFMRSDNIALARRGVVAQTVSSFGLHPQYHQPDDDLAHLDFTHMTMAIDSMVKPVLWLLDSDFMPQWNPGGKP
jgi:aminopeptidase YwaD